MKALINFRKSPHGLLLITAISLFLVLTFSSVANIDFQDKTMFSIPLTTMVKVIPILLLSLWFLYLLTNKLLYSRAIAQIHVLVTVLATILIVSVLYMGIKPSLTTTNNYELVGNAMQILFLIFVLCQLMYLANIVMGFWVKRN